MRRERWHDWKSANLESDEYDGRLVAHSYTSLKHFVTMRSIAKPREEKWFRSLVGDRRGLVTVKELSIDVTGLGCQLAVL